MSILPFRRKTLVAALVLLGAHATQAQQINEFAPNPPGTDPDNQLIELKGVPGSIVSNYWLVAIESDEISSNPGEVNDAVRFTQIFDDDGLATVNIFDFENPSLTLLLTDRFDGVAASTGSPATDLDLDNDGTIDDTSSLGTVFDAIGVPDASSDELLLYADDFGGTNFVYTGDEPQLIFRDGQSGALFAINDPPNTLNGGPAAIDSSGTLQAFSDFTPAVTAEGTFRDPNPALGTTPPPVALCDAPDGEFTPIYTIQGPGHVSPFVAGSLSTVEYFEQLPGDTTADPVLTRGIVTAVDSNSFYLQDPAGDRDDATSDGILVFTGSAPGVSAGDEVVVEARIQEFIPGGAGTRNLPITELLPSEVEVCSTGNTLPAPVFIGMSGRQPPVTDIDPDALTLFDPASDGLDFLESLEGMLVTVEDPVAVSGTNRFGEIFTAVNQGAASFSAGLSARGTLNIAPDDFNPERIQIDEDTGISPFALPAVATGALLGDVTGVVGYGFGNYEIYPTADFSAGVIPSPIAPELTDIAGDDDTLTLASYNVLNLDPNDADGDTDVADGRFAAIASQVVEALNAPDIIGLQEIQDDSGSDDNGIVSAAATLQLLVDAIAAAGGPTYAFIDNTFITDGASGGQPGGNIRTAFLYNPARVTPDGVPGTIGGQGAGEAFAGARLPLVVDFSFNEQVVTVVNNHFSSKGGSAAIMGFAQDFAARQEDPTVNGSLDERQAQSAAVGAYVQSVLDADADAAVVVLGDFNEFEFVSPLQALETAGLTNLTYNLEEVERYSFIFQGNSQSLDHILLSDALLEGASYDAVHVNTEFAESSPQASDHDPVIAGIKLSLPQPEPQSKADCKRGGWETLFRADGAGFRNQGLCIKYVNTGS